MIQTSTDLIEEIVRRVVRIARPDKIVLFGSRARGDARASSDYDLLIIQESDKPRYQRSAPLFALLSDLPAEVEIVVYTPSEVREWSQVPQAFVTRALREGVPLYERKS